MVSKARRAEIKQSRGRTATTITLIVSVAAIIVSVAQVLVAVISKNRELAVTERQANTAAQQKREELELSNKDQELKWKLAVLNYATTNSENLFSPDEKKQSHYLSFMLVTFEHDKYTERLVLEILNMVSKEKPPAPDANLGSDTGALIAKFKGPERLIASNQLVALYAKSKPQGIVDSLIASIISDDKDTGDQFSYRVNLYIALTLGRMKPTGTKAQIEKLKGLKQSSNYNDDTFRQRLDQAIGNFTCSDCKPA